MCCEDAHPADDPAGGRGRVWRTDPCDIGADAGNSFAFTAFPTSLLEDLARFEARLRPAEPSGRIASGGGLFSVDGPIVPLRRGAIRTHRVALRLAFAALVHSGSPRERITGLDVVVEQRTGEDWHYSRAGGRRIEPMGAITNVRRIVGKFHVGLQDKQLEELAAVSPEVGETPG